MSVTTPPSVVHRSQNIPWPIELLGENPEAIWRALALIERTGPRGFENSYPWELSGECSREYLFSIALIHKPLLLLAARRSLQLVLCYNKRYLLESEFIHEKYTTLLVTRDIRKAVPLSDRVVMMNGRPGRTKAELEISFSRPGALTSVQQGA